MTSVADRIEILTKIILPTIDYMTETELQQLEMRITMNRMRQEEKIQEIQIATADLAYMVSELYLAGFRSCRQARVAGWLLTDSASATAKIDAELAKLFATDDENLATAKAILGPIPPSERAPL